MMENEQIVIDLVRFAHILAVACGLGGAIAADLYILRNINNNIEENFLATVKYFHKLIANTLVPLWLTGIALIYIRTNFDITQFSPKLFFKLFVVGLLTINGLVMGPHAIRILSTHQGQKILELSTKQLINLSFMAATSATCWLLALSFGMIKALAVSGPEQLTMVTLLLWMSAITVVSGSFAAMRQLAKS